MSFFNFVYLNVKGEKKAGDDSEHKTGSLRLLPSGPDLIRTALLSKVPGKRESAILAKKALIFYA